MNNRCNGAGEQGGERGCVFDRMAAQNAAHVSKASRKNLPHMHITPQPSQWTVRRCSPFGRAHTHVLSSTACNCVSSPPRVDQIILIMAPVP